MHKGPYGEVVESGREARAGYRDWPVLAITVIGTGMALAALLLLWAIWT